MTLQFSRRNYSHFSVAPLPIREQAQVASDRLQSAIENFVEYGVRRPTESRAFDALKILGEAVESGALLPQHRNDQRGLRALELATDFHTIALALPQQRLADVTREIGIMLSGSLDPQSDSDWTALQYQAQFVVGAALRRGGVEPFLPMQSSAKGKTPDFVIEKGTLQYGVEVKRPRKASNVLARFKDASKQLHEFGVSGMPVVDMTDCVRGMTRDAAIDIIGVGVESICEETFFIGRGFLPGYSHLQGVVVVARLVWAASDKGDHAMIAADIVSRMEVMANTRNSLHDHHARWVRGVLSSGFESIVRERGS